MSRMESEAEYDNWSQDQAAADLLHNDGIHGPLNWVTLKELVGEALRVEGEDIEAAFTRLRDWWISPNARLGGEKPMDVAFPDADSDTLARVLAAARADAEESHAAMRDVPDGPARSGAAGGSELVGPGHDGG